MTSDAIWYAGRCIKRSEKDTAAHLEAVAQLVSGEWRLIPDPKSLFRNMNVIELRAADARQMRVSDWAAFTIGSKSARVKSWPATSHRRLFWYVDLCALGGAEQAQRKLVEGIQTNDPSGVWIVRCAEEEVLQVELRQQEGVVRLIHSGLVSAYRFDPESVVRMPTLGGEVDIYDLKSATPTRTYDWTPDDAFALRIVRAASDAGDAHAGSLIAWLEAQHAKQVGDLLPVKSSDIVAANEALRTGKLAKRLATDQALLRSFMDVLVGDERIGALVKEGVERVAEEERIGARARAEAEATREIEVSHKKRLAALEVELEKAAQKGWKSMSEDLDKLRVDAEATLQKTIATRIDAMEKQVREQDAHYTALCIEVGHAKAAVEDERKKAASLRAEVAEVQASLNATHDSLVAAATELAAEQARLAAMRRKCPVIGPPGAAKRLTLERVGAEIEASRLLSDRGKSLMAHFLALTLAGDVPVLCGPGVDDFLLAAEMIFGGGYSVRMEGDPTILTFEDLWIRAGTDLRTGFGQALAITGGVEGTSRTTLAVVERAERSGARFWYPALADRARRGGLPRGLLLCATIEDRECEEAVEIMSRAVSLDVNDVLVSDSSFLLAMAVASAETASELDVGSERADISLGVARVTADAPQLSAAWTVRAMRAVAEASSLFPSARLSGLVQLFLDASGQPASVNRF